MTFIPAMMGFRNRLINGSMQVDVRNRAASQTFVAGTLAYCVDRFYIQSTGANITGSQSAGTAPDQFVYVATGAASITGILMGQRIEAANIYDLAGQNVTFSCKIANNVLTTVTWTAYYANATDNFSAKTSISTGTFTVGSTLATYAATIALPNNAINGVCIELSVGAQTSGVWTTTEWQLEPGIVPTIFERIPLTVTQLLCQRYCPAPSQGTLPGPIAPISFQSTTVAHALIQFLVPARVSPTSVVTSAAGNFGTEANGGSDTVTAIAFGWGASLQMAVLFITVATVSTIGFTGVFFAGTSPANIYFNGCEL